MNTVSRETRTRRAKTCGTELRRTCSNLHQAWGRLYLTPTHARVGSSDYVGGSKSFGRLVRHIVARLRETARLRTTWSSVSTENSRSDLAVRYDCATYKEEFFFWRELNELECDVTRSVASCIWFRIVLWNRNWLKWELVKLIKFAFLIVFFSFSWFLNKFFITSSLVKTFYQTVAVICRSSPNWIELWINPFTTAQY